MTDWASVFLQDPTLGLPVTLLAGTIAGWIAWNARDRPRSVVRATPRPVPDRDPVSRTYRAFESNEFSDVLTRALRRLDVVSTRRFGRPLRRLPKTAWGRRRLSPDRPEELGRLLRARSEVDRLLTITSRREAGIWVRYDFWRSHEQLYRRFRLRLAPLLDEVTELSTVRTVAA